jgi:hypothetical protein
MRKQKSIVARLGAWVLVGSFAAIPLPGMRFARAAAPPPPPHQRLEDQVLGLDLTPEQKEKVQAAVDDLQRKQRQLHEDFQRQLSSILTAEQMQKLQQAGPPGPPPEGGNPPPNAPATQPAMVKDLPKGTVVFTGGYQTDPRDHGRPVVLIAAALGVPTDTFRTAFSGVTPAGGGSEPQPEQVHKNKDALLKVLQPLGVTNDRLDTVSNYYRYNGGKGEMWKNKPATATAIIANGAVTGIKVTDAGAGYSSPPTVTVVGYENVHATVELSFGTDLPTNGSIKSVTLK